MRLQRLTLRNVRCVVEAGIAPGPQLNLLLGANGAGKTTVLEAIHLLGYGRSFRCRVRDGMIRTGSEAVEMFAEVHHDRPPAGSLRRIGLRHAGSQWSGRLDGADVAHLASLCAALPVITFEPGSHALVTGSGDPRRRQLDWGLFHVEHDATDPVFLPQWRRYARALKQRNRLLKQSANDTQLDAWDHELAESGELLTRARVAYLEQLAPHVQALGVELTRSLGQPGLEYQPGWPREQMGLADALLQSRARDRHYGHTAVGPHRGDWQMTWSALHGGEALSRGQAKLTALAWLLAQARLHAQHSGHWPVILLDDLASELDGTHQQRVLQWLHACGAQVFVTGTDRPEAIARLQAGAAVFHVEHGDVRQIDLPVSDAC